MNKFSFKWKLDNIQDLCNNPNSEYPFIDSPTFSPLSHEHEFNLRLYPKGYDSESREYISLILHFAKSNSPNGKIKIQFEISIVDREGNKLNTKQNSATLKENSGKGFRKFIPREAILNKQLLVDGKLIFLVEVEIITEPYQEFRTNQISLEVSKNNSIQSIEEFSMENKMQTERTSKPSSQENIDSMIKSETPFSISHKWIIGKFEYFFSENSPTLSVMYSNAFPTSNKLQFSLRFLPKHFDEIDQTTYVAIFLYLKHCEMKNDNISVYYEFSIINLKGEKLFFKGETKSFKQEDSYGCDKFVRIDDLLDQSKGFLPNGNLIILCEAKIFADKLNNDDKTLINFATENRFNCDLKINQVTRLWEIEQFSSFFYGSNASIEKYLCIQSKNFPENKENANKYYLRLWPKGIDKNSDGFVSICLNCEVCTQTTTDHKDFAQYRLSILDRSGEFFHSCEGKIEFLNDTTLLGQGSRKFLAIDSIFDPKNGLLPGEKLTIYCEIEESQHLDTNFCKFHNTLKYNWNIKSSNTYTDLEAGKFSHTWTDIVGDSKISFDELPFDRSLLKRIEQDFSKLLESGDLSDVVFVVEGQELRAHKVFLASRSRVFNALFKNFMGESNKTRIKIIDVGLEVFQDLLSYIYTGKYQPKDQNIAELFIAADKYDLENLKNLCENSLCSQVNHDTVTTLLNLADTYKAEKLKTTLFDYINLHASWLMENEKFISEISKQLLVELYHDLKKKQKFLKFK